MFNDFQKMNSGRTTIKIIATLLVFTLTFANFAILGSYISQSIAVDLSGNNNINIENVNFDVAFDSNDKSKKQISANINSEDLILYICIEVQNEGRIENARIDFTNSNFELMGKQGKYGGSIETITAGNTKNIEVPIVARKNDIYKLDLLNMTSKINLTGEYIDNNGNITSLNLEREVKVEWKTDSIENEDIILSQEVITNKIYKTNGINKRVVQLSVKANIENNKVPVKEENIEIEVPRMETKPEQVKVTAKSTMATNGKTGLGFENKEYSKYEYKEEEQKIYIDVFNIENDEHEVAWTKNVQDEFIITFIYDENTEVTPFISNAKVVFSIYGKDNKIEKNESLNLQENERRGDIVTFEKNIPQEIYKGFMYALKDTEYETKESIFVSYSDLVQKMEIRDIGEGIETQNLEVYFKKTKINKEQAINLLGKEGIIKIYNSENTQTPVQEISLSQETEDEYYLVEYNNEISKITIETTKPIKEGSLEIVNEKVLKAKEVEALSQIDLITTGASLTVTDSKDEMLFNISRVSSIKLKEPVTKIDIFSDKKSISNQIEENLKLTVVLNTIDSSNKLFKNPVLNIELPSEIEKAQIDKISSPLYDDELKIKSQNIIKNEYGNNVLVLELEGEQTKYNTNEIVKGTNIVVDLKVKAKEFVANQDIEIKAICFNEEDTAEAKKNISIISKEGLLTKTNVIVDGKQINSQNINITDISKSKNVNIQVEIINNYSSVINNFVITQKLQTEDENILNSTRLQNVQISGVETNIFYSQNNEEWTNEFDEDANLRLFKIELDNFESRQNIVLTYNLLIQKGIESNSFIDSLIVLNGKIENKEINKEIKLEINFGGSSKIEEDDGSNTAVYQNNGIRLIVTSENSNNILHENQIVTYLIEVINSSEEEINNLELEFTKSEIASIINSVNYAELEIDIDKSNDKSQKMQIEHLKPGEKIEKEISVYIENINEDKVTMKHNITIRNAQNDEIISADIEQTVKKANLNLTYSTKTNDDGVFEDSEITYILAVNNPLEEEKINNCLVQIKIPEGTTFVENNKNENQNVDDVLNDFDEEDIWQDFSYDETNKLLTKRIDEIAPEGSVYLKFTVKVNKKTTENIESIALVSLNNEVYESNKIVKRILPIKYSMEVNSKVEETIQKYGDITYAIKIKNEGQYTGVIKIQDEIPEQIAVANVTTYIEGTEEKTEEVLNSSEGKTVLNISKSIEPSTTLIIEITGTISSEEENKETIEIENIINLILNNEIINTKSVKNTVRVVKEDDDEAEIPEKKPSYDLEGEKDEQDTQEEDTIDDKENNDEEKQEEENTPNNQENQNISDDKSENKDDEKQENKGNDKQEESKSKFSISGVAWVDENKDGLRSNNEKILQGIKVYLVDKKGNVIKDENGKEITTLTTINGTYKLNNLEKGEYIVVFEYDTSKYSVTEYQEENVKEEINSDFISKEINLDGEPKIVAISDTLKIDEEDLNNIDLGLIINPIFDLSLNKYISKVTVTTDTGVTTYDYTNTNFTKVEIPAKKITGAVLLVEYEIELQNKGTIDGYVEDILDYTPEGFLFNSDLNEDWYEDSEDILHNVELSEVEIKPDQSKIVKIVFSKRLSDSSTGTIENIAEIGKSSNLEALDDINSSPGNNIGGEDDISSARLIISIATGSTPMYIGIVILSLLVLGVGIFLINKNVLRREEITWKI